MAEVRPGAPCWPIVWLWVLSIAQYGYRYILQVNDPGTSIGYAYTPAALSALKYALFLAFAMYAVVRFSQRSVSLSHTYRVLLPVLGGALATLAVILLIRLTASLGGIDQTATCALELIPWMSIVFFIPFVVKPEHSVTRTLIAFERIIFWIVSPFWLATVLLAIFEIRYPALSYPGLLLRFGGILDDPNGYACLCLFFLVLAATGRSRHWKLRAAVYLVMLLATLSLTGYVTATIMSLGYLLSRILKPKALSKRSLLRPLAYGAAFAIVIAVGLAIYETNEAVNAITSVYAAKDSSIAAHTSSLLPDEVMWDTSSPVAMLCGVGGFSENFYWRILVNFGWIGLLAIASVIISWTYCALRRARRWRYPIGSWAAALLIGSNGIAYLLTFPLNLIYWSVLALLLYARDGESGFPA